MGAIDQEVAKGQQLQGFPALQRRQAQAAAELLAWWLFVKLVHAAALLLSCRGGYCTPAATRGDPGAVAV